jgi:hypothetical protein
MGGVVLTLQGDLNTVRYVAAMTFYVVGGVWFAGYWLIEYPAPRNAKNRPLTMAKKRALLRRWAGIVVTVAITVPMCVGTIILRNEYVLAQRIDIFIPRGEAAPDKSCANLPASALAVYMGNVGAYASTFPRKIISVNNKPILTLDRDQGGNVTITIDIYDEKDDLVASINRNRFGLFGDAIMNRVDRSALEITLRHRKEKVLEIVYYNKQSIGIKGVFRTPGESTVTASDAGLWIDGQTFHGGMSGFCAKSAEPNTGEAMFAF